MLQDTTAFIDVAALTQDMCAGDRATLARAITLIEKQARRAPRACGRITSMLNLS